MKATLLLLVPAALLSSCTQNPFVKQDTPVAPAANPENPYGVPNAAYPAPATPYEKAYDINRPALPSGINPPPAEAATYSVPKPVPVNNPNLGTLSSPELNGNVYTIKKGDSLWGISRKFGTSVEALKEENGLTSDVIIDGRTLIIPGR